MKARSWRKDLRVETPIGEDWLAICTEEQPDAT